MRGQRSPAEKLPPCSISLSFHTQKNLLNTAYQAGRNHERRATGVDLLRIVMICQAVSMVVENTPKEDYYDPLENLKDGSHG